MTKVACGDCKWFEPNRRGYTDWRHSAEQMECMNEAVYMAETWDSWLLLNTPVTRLACELNRDNGCQHHEKHDEKK